MNATKKQRYLASQAQDCIINLVGERDELTARIAALEAESRRLREACEAVWPFVESDTDEFGADDPYQVAIGKLRTALEAKATNAEQETYPMFRAELYRLNSLNAKLVEACEAMVEICRHRWRALPAETPEKSALQAVESAIAAAKEAL